MNSIGQQTKDIDVASKKQSDEGRVLRGSGQPSLYLDNWQDTIAQLSDKVGDMITFISDAKNGAQAILYDIETMAEDVRKYSESVKFSNELSSGISIHQASYPEQVNVMASGNNATLQENYAHVCEQNGILENKIKYYQKDYESKNKKIEELEKRISELEYDLYKMNADSRRQSWEEEKQQRTERNDVRYI